MASVEQHTAAVCERQDVNHAALRQTKIGLIIDALAGA